MEGHKRQVVSLLYLIGMPGAGKSYWAREISHAYTLPLIDMDEYIEQQEGDSISGIFKQYGEDIFRKKEQDALAAISAHTSTAVIACGGGTPCYFDNMAMMLQSGTVVYLKATISILISHLRTEAHQRPLLAAENDVDKILTNLLSERAVVYEKAHHILDVDNISIANFAQIIAYV